MKTTYHIQSVKTGVMKQRTANALRDLFKSLLGARRHAGAVLAGLPQNRQGHEIDG
jgi:hypothetical protein